MKHDELIERLEMDASDYYTETSKHLVGEASVALHELQAERDALKQQVDFLQQLERPTIDVQATIESLRNHSAALQQQVEELKAEIERAKELFATLAEALDIAHAHILGQHDYPHIPTDRQVCEVLDAALDLCDGIGQTLTGGEAG